MSKIKAVIFDFDGVVADTGKDIVASVQAAQRQYKLNVLDYTTIMSYVGHGAKYLIDKSMSSLSEKELSEALLWYKEYYKSHPCDKTQLYEGFEELAEELHKRNISMCIVSNKPEPITRLIADKLNITKYFTKILGPESLTRMKPDPEGLNICMKAMKSSAYETIMVGDSYTDIQAGKSAGTFTCAVMYGYGDKEKLKAENADISISAVLDFINEIEKI